MEKGVKLAMLLIVLGFTLAGCFGGRKDNKVAEDQCQQAETVLRVADSNG